MILGEGFPGSILFCCDHNAVRSPMAEGLMKKLYGQRAYVQSAGVHNDLEVDGFAITVSAELGVELARHRSRSFDEMVEWGDDLSGFDLIVALSPASQRAALELTRYAHTDVEYWPTVDPTAVQGSRDQVLDAYRAVRDGLMRRIKDRLSG